MKIDTAYSIGEQVHIDGDRAITATITAISIAGAGGCRVQYEAAWLHNGSAASGWFDAFRLGLLA